jgi:DNA-binding NarL/FixJ family response regulator
MASGMNNKEIGSALFITEGTVKVHVHHILTKLSVNSRTGAVSEGLRRRLLSI